MPERRERRWGSLIAGSCLAGVATALFGMAFPAMVLAPVLFAWLRMRHGTVGGISGIGLCLIAGAFLGSLEAISAAVTFGAAGLLMAWGWERGRGPRAIIALTALPLGALSILQAAVLVRPDARDRFLSELGAVVDETARLPSLLGTRPEDLEAARHLALRAGEILWLLTPAVGLLTAVVSSFAAYRIAQWIFPRWGIDLTPVAPFRSWALGERFVWVVAAGLVLEISRLSWATAVGRNLLVIGGFAYLVQGASILGYVLQTKRVSRAAQVLVWIIGVVILQPMSSVLAIVAGFLDTWIDFRTRLGPHRT